MIFAMSFVRAEDMKPKIAIKRSVKIISDLLI